MGSVLHRSGLALDAQYLDKVRMNRSTLDPGNKSGAQAETNVSDSEAEAFRKYLEAEKEAAAAHAELKKAEAAAAAATKESKKTGGTPEQIEARKAAVKKAGAEVARTKLDWEKRQRRWKTRRKPGPSSSPRTNPKA